jgi:catechol 2,3-dioxygenase-like lactoylglutathione lyase family enzyme
MKHTGLYASFAVRDTDVAKVFYRDTLGLEVRDGQIPGIIDIVDPGGSHVLVYAKPDHVPATFTVLNIDVPDIDAAVDDLGRAGVTFEHYDSEYLKTDARGIARGNGPSIAWFRDPDGNIVAILQTAGA